jgi:hypothetical protein
MQRDINNVRFVGVLALTMGVVLFVLTALTTLFLLFASTTANGGTVEHGALGVALSLVMASTLSSLGGQMQRLRPDFMNDPENLRLVWTALVVMMVIFGLAGLWLVPPLSGLAILMLFALFGIRGSVIRLTNK